MKNYVFIVYVIALDDTVVFELLINKITPVGSHHSSEQNEQYIQDIKTRKKVKTNLKCI